MLFLKNFHDNSRRTLKVILREVPNQVKLSLGLNVAYMEKFLI